MLRFSIRELMVVMLATATALAWFSEHRQLRAAIWRESVEKMRREELEEQIDQVDKQLGSHGLQIGWRCTGRGVAAVVCKDSPAEQLSANQNSN